MTDIEKKLIADMIDVGKKMYMRGFVAANDGNLSVRCPDGVSAIITPSGVSKGSMSEDMFVKVRISDGEIIEGTHKPSIETKMHLRLYIENPDICAAVHAHPMFATTFAIARTPLDAPIYPASMMNLGSVHVAEYSPPGTEGVAESVAPFAKNSRALLLANHGALTWARDILTAWYRMEELENFAHLTFNTLYVMKQAAEVPVIAPLPDKK